MTAGANDYRTLSEAEAAKWALIFPLSDVPADLNDAEAEHVAAMLEGLWFKDMKANRPHVIPRECGPDTVKGFRAMCRSALKSRILARRVVS